MPTQVDILSSSNNAGGLLQARSQDFPWGGGGGGGGGGGVRLGRNVGLPWTTFRAFFSSLAPSKWAPESIF